MEIFIALLIVSLIVAVAMAINNTIKEKEGIKQDPLEIKVKKYTNSDFGKKLFKISAMALFFMIFLKMFPLNITITHQHEIKELPVTIRGSNYNGYINVHHEHTGNILSPIQIRND